MNGTFLGTPRHGTVALGYILSGVKGHEPARARLGFGSAIAVALAKYPLDSKQSRPERIDLYPVLQVEEVNIKGMVCIY